MEIKICTTSEWSESDWKTYVIGFNEVFNKSFSEKHFYDKYTLVDGGFSYHALLVDDSAGVVGGCTIIPCRYKNRNEPFLIGLAVDVFICEAYRTDPLMLRRMYKKLRVFLQEQGIVSVMAVPNDTAYSYWKNVVKWKDVGTLNYWVIPFRVGNILKKHVFLNVFSLFYVKIIMMISILVSFIKTKTLENKYCISPDDCFLKHRYQGDYNLYNQNDFFYAYRIVIEDGVKTAYLLDATEGGKRSFSSFFKAVNLIKEDKIDLIVYIGKIGFFQTLFLKVPKKFEPKQLPLTCDLISKDDKYIDMHNINNWDFGLKNYDVR